MSKARRNLTARRKAAKKMERYLLDRDIERSMGVRVSFAEMKQRIDALFPDGLPTGLLAGSPIDAAALGNIIHSDPDLNTLLSNMTPMDVFETAAALIDDAPELEGEPTRIYDRAKA